MHSSFAEILGCIAEILRSSAYSYISFAEVFLEKSYLVKKKGVQKGHALFPQKIQGSFAEILGCFVKILGSLAYEIGSVAEVFWRNRTWQKNVVKKGHELLLQHLEEIHAPFLPRSFARYD